MSKLTPINRMKPFFTQAKPVLHKPVTFSTDDVMQKWHILRSDVEHDYIYVNMFNYILELKHKYIKTEHDIRTFQNAFLDYFSKDSVNNVKSHPIHIGGVLPGLDHVASVLIEMLFELCLDITKSTISHNAQKMIDGLYMNALKNEIKNVVNLKSIDTLFLDLIDKVKISHSDIIKNAINNPSEQAFQLRDILRHEFPSQTKNGLSLYVNPLEVLYYKPSNVNNNDYIINSNTGNKLMKYTIGDIIFDILVVSGIQAKTFCNLEKDKFLKKMKKSLSGTFEKFKGSFKRKQIFPNSFNDLNLESALSISSFGSSIEETFSVYECPLYNSE